MATDRGAEVTEREWPGIWPGQPHGTPWENDHTSDPHQYCEACGAIHHARNRTCDGLRVDVSKRCDSVLGEIRCHRPLGHPGEHKADSKAMRVEWRVKDHG